MHRVAARLKLIRPAILHIVLALALVCQSWATFSHHHGNVGTASLAIKSEIGWTKADPVDGPIGPTSDSCAICQLVHNSTTAITAVSPQLLLWFMALTVLSPITSDETRTANLFNHPSPRGPPQA